MKKFLAKEISKIFLNEEKGVPDDVIKAYNFIENKIVEVYSKINNENWELLKDVDGKEHENALMYKKNIHIYGDDLFFDDLDLFIYFIKVNDKITDLEISNSNRGRLFKGKTLFNKKDKKVDYAYIELSLCLRENESIVNKNSRHLIFHELMHLYEQAQRNLKGNNKETRHDVYNQIEQNIIHNDIIKNVNFLIYCMFYFEGNANIGGLYNELMFSDAYDFDTLEKELYESRFYNNYLIHLKNPENFIKKEDIVKLENSDFNIINTKIEEWLKKYNFKNTRNFYFYYRGNKEQYFKRLFDLSKKTYEDLLKRSKKVIDKVIKDKNNSLIKESYNKYKSQFTLFAKGDCLFPY